jgi:prepilin-type N-terminal cleavage/methylation domain-containing protein
MLRRHTRLADRSAFTLVELLVVIAIIAILVSLTAAAVMKAMLKINEVQTRTDIGEMDQAMASFMTDYNLQYPPPSILNICENGSQYFSNGQVQPQYASTVAFLQLWFGKTFNVAGTYDWNGDGNTNQTYVLQGQQCLVFYLGGIPSYSSGAIGMTGFYPNVGYKPPNLTGPATPATAGTTRKGPYFNFIPSRLVASPCMSSTPVGVTFPVYIDAWGAKPTPQPYVFFSSQGKMNGYNNNPNNTPPNDCSLVDSAGPYYDVTANNTPNFAFPNRYQIISAGQDGQFGGGQWNSAAGATGAGKDDQANFSAGLLGSGQH